MSDQGPSQFVPRPVVPGGDAFGTHRSLEPKGALPQPAQRLDNDFTRLYGGEALVAVQTLTIDAASFAQMEAEARERGAVGDEELKDAVAHMVLRTVADRGKQQNPVTGSG